jgi:hypothetical protein
MNSMGAYVKVAMPGCQCRGCYVAGVTRMRFWRQVAAELQAQVAPNPALGPQPQAVRQLACHQ